MAIRRKRDEIDYRAEAQPEQAVNERQTFAAAGEAWLGNVKTVRKPSTHELYSQRYNVTHPGWPRTEWSITTGTTRGAAPARTG